MSHPTYLLRFTCQLPEDGKQVNKLESQILLVIVVILGSATWILTTTYISYMYLLPMKIALSDESLSQKDIGHCCSCEAVFFLLKSMTLH